MGAPFTFSTRSLRRTMSLFPGDLQFQFFMHAFTASMDFKTRNGKDLASRAMRMHCGNTCPTTHGDAQCERMIWTSETSIMERCHRETEKFAFTGEDSTLHSRRRGLSSTALLEPERLWSCSLCRSCSFGKSRGRATETSFGRGGGVLGMVDKRRILSHD